ncbi:MULTISPECIES: DUF4261 domain-containing protein [Myroides]|uniref:DUF4261 domain-containing protein n=1 Tax=Myroides albus TaxID=2562892 RepID=A0A6I3LRV4_9FLAO|nr:MULTISPECIES: DUF4261 domain-containing protein [Myroides]MTG98705.1 DUF4261 domain-containing protein [Myroides albus]MVX35655.1 DUF4261 domain-containing protein [Myroides sp. LoEW2-1]UVD78798.1 DUF4261 domain-containing protein [Myroides albus]
MGSKKLGNSPKMLMFQLLYKEQPNIDYQAVLVALQQVYPSVEFDPGAHVFIFPEIEVEFEDKKGPAQCVVMEGEKDKRSELQDTFFQQNWHWNEAATVERECHYALSISDFMSRGLEPRVRIVLIQQMLLALIKVSKPEVLVSIHGEKLIDPEVFAHDCLDPNYVGLDLLVNVRLFNIENPEYKQFLMDTIGLHSLGMSDFEIFFDEEENLNAIAGRLWDYAYYIMQAGDVIEDGHTIQGLEEDSKWLCQKKWSETQPKRTVLDIEVV